MEKMKRKGYSGPKRFEKREGAAIELTLVMIGFTG